MEEVYLRIRGTRKFSKCKGALVTAVPKGSGTRPRITVSDIQRQSGACHLNAYNFIKLLPI